METTQPESLLAINPDESHIRATNLFNNTSKGFKNDFANGNIGNLCFAASILQLLMHVPPFVQLITTLTDKGALVNLKIFLVDERHLLSKNKPLQSTRVSFGAFFVKRLA